MSPLLLLALLAPPPAAWQPLFDGKTLQGWRDTPFARHAPVRVENGIILLAHGQPMTGITATAPIPRTNYELRFEAARLKGNDFFASCTFPVQDSFATWVTGGWGGDIVGLSSIDGWDASENETRSYFTFEDGRYYTFRLQVAPDRIAAWIDDQQVFNVGIAGRRIDLRRGDISLSTPLGFASYNTTGAIRKIEIRPLP
jgi:hypothetical protein